MERINGFFTDTDKPMKKLTLSIFQCSIKFEIAIAFFVEFSRNYLRRRIKENLFFLSTGSDNSIHSIVKRYMVWAEESCLFFFRVWSVCCVQCFKMIFEENEIILFEDIVKPIEWDVNVTSAADIWKLLFFPPPNFSDSNMQYARKEKPGHGHFVRRWFLLHSFPLTPNPCHSKLYDNTYAFPVFPFVEQRNFFWWFLSNAKYI